MYHPTALDFALFVVGITWLATLDRDRLAPITRYFNRRRRARLARPLIGPAPDAPVRLIARPFDFERDA